MSAKEIYLFVFEGQEDDPRYVELLEKNFFSNIISVKCVYGAEIYQLYREMKDDDFALDIVNILKERSPQNAEILKDFNRESFASIYLFFDYDAHSTLANDHDIQAMISFFNNETEQGLLYISYPMLEAIRHFKDMQTFKDLSVKCKRGKTIEASKCPNKYNCPRIDACLKEKHYKKIARAECRRSLNRVNDAGYPLAVWKELIKAHLFKANYLTRDTFCMPSTPIPQDEIFEYQLMKFISQECPLVSVISALPLFVLDYYGVEYLNDKLNI